MEVIMYPETSPYSGYSNPMTSPVPTPLVQTAPEPVEVSPQTEAGVQAAARAQAALLESQTWPKPTMIAAVESVQRASIVPRSMSLASIEKEEYEGFKEQINDSFGEIANLLLDMQSRFQLLDERIDNYNKKGGHKI
jgi:hypothetical protein